MWAQAKKFDLGDSSFGGILKNLRGDQSVANFASEPANEITGAAGDTLSIYRPKKADGVRTMVGYAQEKDGKWNATPFYSSRLIVSEGVRNLILIFREPKPARPISAGLAS
jgi:hypothetical protein